MLPAAILQGGRLALGAKAHRYEHQPGLAAAHPRAKKFVEFLLMVPNAAVQFLRVDSLRFSPRLRSRDHVFHRPSPITAATCVDAGDNGAGFLQWVQGLAPAPRYMGIFITGRTSTAPNFAPGIRAAIEIASSRSFASTR